MKYKVICNLGKSLEVKELMEELGISVLDFNEEADTMAIETIEAGRERASELPGVVSVSNMELPWS